MSRVESSDPKFEHLLEYLRQSRGSDFTGYKRPSLMRRINRRMQTVSVGSYDEYVDYLEVHPNEFPELFNTILINVTSFFRDPAAWGALSESAIPRLVRSQDSDGPIRVWSAGCSSGEEAYSIAMLLAEALGRDQFRKRVKIYATDIDEEALARGRQASYSGKEVQGVNESLRAKYFEMIGDKHVFNSDLRRCIVFGRHDLVQDAPMSRLDLVICRNTLMYFNAETQARVLGRFNSALKPNGILFLGKAEMLLVQSNLFTPVDLKHRIFCKRAAVSLRDRMLLFAETAGVPMETATQVERQTTLRDIVLDAARIAQVIVDTHGNLIMANQLARQLFRIAPNDMGRPFQDFELSYRPVELRSLIDQANAENRVVAVTNLEYRTSSNETSYFDIQVAPLRDGDATLGVCISFDDVTRYHRLEEQLQRAQQEAETVNEELQAANEELQSTNEELETTNEELQSTNEELETMNEELQSTNEELQTMNEELRDRTDELNNSNAFLGSILSSLRAGVAVVDKTFKIIIWNSAAEELWGLRSDEVKGKSLFSLDSGLPVDELRTPLRLCLSDGADGANHQELILNATNRRGRSIKCRVGLSPFHNLKGERQGAVITMEEMGM